MGSTSINLLNDLFPYLRDFSINNIQCNKLLYQPLLKSCIQNNIQLMKLKLSNVNLQDDHVTDLLVELLNTKEFLTHLDLSWTGLTPKHLVKISNVLIDENSFSINNIRNLNLSYNSLYFDPTASKPLPSD